MPSGSAERARRGRLVAALAAAPVLVALCLLAGRYPSPGLMDPGLPFRDPVAAAVLFGSRLPRLLGALLLGAVMAAAGNAFQTVFGNPLVEPGFLGVSQGAALGAALALSLSATGPVVAGCAFACALAALALAGLLSRLFKFGGWVLRLVLAGFTVSALASSALAFVKAAADPLRALPDIAWWTMGSLAGFRWESLGLEALPCAISLGVLFLLRWRIAALSLDEAVVSSLGLRPAASRNAVLAAASLGVASVVAVCGAVSWIGLAVPHAARSLFGYDTRRSMPASMLLGALFAAVCDTAARAALPGEIPLGAVTAALGSALFAALLASGRVDVRR